MCSRQGLCRHRSTRFPCSRAPQAGYKCSIFGLFWAYFHIWGCEPVAVKGLTVYTDPEIGKAVAAKYTESDMKVGLWTKHGRWVFVAIVIVLIIGAIRGRGDDDDEDRRRGGERGRG